MTSCEANAGFCAVDALGWSAWRRVGAGGVGAGALGGVVGGVAAGAGAGERAGGGGSSRCDAAADRASVGGRGESAGASVERVWDGAAAVYVRCMWRGRSRRRVRRSTRRRTAR